jgi:hypothetical protein
VAEVATASALSWSPDGRWLVAADLGATAEENGIDLIPIDAG